MSRKSVVVTDPVKAERRTAMLNTFVPAGSPISYETQVNHETGNARIVQVLATSKGEKRVVAVAY